MNQSSAIIGGLALWLCAVAGAIGVAVWLELSTQDAAWLIVIVAVIAFFGALVPVVRLGKNRKT